MTQPRHRIAVLLPCYNEAATIAQVVSDFRAALPQATIYVGDNNSTDDSIALARAAGAVVISESQKGKGNVVRRLFADVEADIYIMADADATYDAAIAPQLVATLLEHRLDLVNARRVTDAQAAYRPGHRFGNLLLSRTVAGIFGDRIEDMLSGYKAFSKRFVKSFPALTTGFEIETEILVHALELRMPLREVETRYSERPPGSFSKLSTYKDGALILLTITKLLRAERPLLFFSAIFAVLAAAALGVGIPVVLEFLETGLVPRLPTAVLATGLSVLAFMSLMCGVILDLLTHARREIKRLHYLALPAIAAPEAQPVAAATDTPGA